jgi:hypothetical protein
MRCSLGITFLLLAAGACSFDPGGLDLPEEIDDRDDHRDQTGADPYIDRFPYSPTERAAILEIANTADFVELDLEVRLDVRAARNIVNRRNGPDLTFGTDDDRPYQSLPQLDRVKWVGPTALNKLVEYAYDVGMIDG